MPQDSRCTARSEARALLPLLKRPRETVESVCALIRLTPKHTQDIRASERTAEAMIRYRARVLDFFQVFAGLKPAPELPPESAPESFPVEQKPRVSHVKFDRAAMLEEILSGQSAKQLRGAWDARLPMSAAWPQCAASNFGTEGARNFPQSKPHPCIRLLITAHRGAP